MENYNFKKIENKWHKNWIENKTFKTTEDDSKEYFYALDMFPYPSGAGLHVGHLVGYIATDIISRYKRMTGYNVLHAIGWDAFGLPAEQYAIKTGNHPAEFTSKNIDTFRGQLQLLGFSLDWDKEINTSDPEYYKWTQWIFFQLVKHSLAELREVSVNWCEELSTVLANDEIKTDENENQVSERGGYPVIQKPMTQWVIKSTAFADKLVNGLEKLDWLESTKIMQKNWIFDEVTGNMLLRDWIFSRQRYWGEPFPIKYNLEGKPELINESQLPLILPTLLNFNGKDGKPALANSQWWLENKYDLNTMPGSAGSSWYHLAYILKDESGYLPLNSSKAKAKLNKWMPVDLYVGGTEHTTGHLIYARIWNNFLKDIGILNIAEPYQKLIHQGMILGHDGKKMSKSKGNVVNPNDVIEKYGVDSLRAYIVFIGAFEDLKLWSDKGAVSINKWLKKVWNIITTTTIVNNTSLKLEKIYAQTVDKVTEQIKTYKFNVALSQLMIFINHVVAEKQITQKMIKGFIQLLNPICPHITEELWERHGFVEELSYSQWPTIDKSLLKENDFNLVIMENGKFRGTIKLIKGIKEEEVIQIVKYHKVFAKYLKNTKQIIYVQDKVLNIVR